MSISLINLYGQGYGRDEESYKAANSYLPGIHMLIEYEITEIFYLRNFWPDIGSRIRQLLAYYSYLISTVSQVFMDS